jgi:hypothetical protein
LVKGSQVDVLSINATRSRERPMAAHACFAGLGKDPALPWALFREKEMLLAGRTP